MHGFLREATCSEQDLVHGENRKFFYGVIWRM
jgi:hypothetical protein